MNAPAPGPVVRSGRGAPKGSANALVTPRALSSPGWNLRRLIKPLYDRHQYVHLSCNLLQRAAPPALDRFPVHALGPQHAAALRDTGQRVRAIAPSAPRWIEFSLRMAYPGFVAFDGHRLFAWFFCVPAGHPRAAAHPHLARFGITLRAGDVYAYEFFVEPEFRGAGRGAEFVLKMHELLRSAGHRRILAWCEAANTPALTLYRNAGWAQEGRSSAVVLLRRFLFAGGRLFLRNARDSEVPVDFRPAFGRRVP